MLLRNAANAKFLVLTVCWLLFQTIVSNCSLLRVLVPGRLFRFFESRLILLPITRNSGIRSMQQDLNAKHNLIGGCLSGEASVSISYVQACEVYPAVPEASERRLFRDNMSPGYLVGNKGKILERFLCYQRRCWCFHLCFVKPR